MLLTLFEELMILKIFNRKENEPFTAQQEVSLISIKKNKEIFSNRVNINFSNPIFSDMKIVQISNNELITNFIEKLKKNIIDLKKITLNIYEITKSDFTKGNYQSFLIKFIDVLESSNFHNYFFSLVKIAHKCFEEKSYEEAYKKLPIASYICECILFVKASLFEKIEEKIYFDRNELIKQFNEIFEEEKKETNTVQISVLKISQEKKRYILISFLGVLFRYFKNSMDINQYALNQNKSALDGLFSFYPSLMKLLVDTKNKMIKN